MYDWAWSNRWKFKACAHAAPLPCPPPFVIAPACEIYLQAALDASGKGGKGGGKGDRAQGISQGVDTIDTAMEVARNATF